MKLAVAYPWVLILLPLSLVPLYFHGHKTLVYSTLSMVPADRLSDFLGIALRGAAALAIGLLVLAVSGLHQPARVIERIGQGAQIVLVLDRSTSMDEPFAGQEQVTHPRLTIPKHESKGHVARQLLSEFVANRGGDMFSLLVFSTFPIRILPFTQKQDIVQAAIKAGSFGRGLAETNIAAGLKSALESFDDRPYTGSRVIILLSDGAGELDRPSRRQIESLMQRNRVVLYWIYIRSRNSPRILQDTEDTVAQGLSPERSLYRFFSEMDAPFRAYTAESPRALEHAIAEVGRLQNLPNRYPDVIPKRDVSHVCYRMAFLLTLLLTFARLLEVRSWR